MNAILPKLMLFLVAPVSCAQALPDLKPSDLDNSRLPGPHEVRVEFQSQDEVAYNCAVDVVRSYGLNLEVTVTMGPTPKDNKKSMKVTKTFAKLDASTNDFVSSFMRCQSKAPSTASWTVSTKSR